MPPSIDIFLISSALKFQLSPFNLQPTSDYTVIRFVIHVLFCNPFPYYFKIQYNIHGLFICCCTTDRSWERNSFITSFCNSLYMTSSSLSLNLLLLSSSWYVAFFDRVTFPLKNFTVSKKFSKSEHGPYFSLHKSHKKNCDATRIGELGFNRITLKLLVSFKIEILTVLLSSAILNYVALFICVVQCLPSRKIWIQETLQHRLDFEKSYLSQHMPDCCFWDSTKIINITYSMWCFNCQDSWEEKSRDFWANRRKCVRYTTIAQFLATIKSIFFTKFFWTFSTILYYTFPMHQVLVSSEMLSIEKTFG